MSDFKTNFPGTRSNRFQIIQFFAVRFLRAGLPAADKMRHHRRRRENQKREGFPPRPQQSDTAEHSRGQHQRNIPIGSVIPDQSEGRCRYQMPGWHLLLPMTMQKRWPAGAQGETSSSMATE
jgi:hypothetical protein